MIVAKNIKQIYNVYNQKLVEFCITYLKLSEQNADDLVQEVFLKLLEKEKKGYLPKHMNYKYLRKVLVRVFLNQIDKGKRTQKKLNHYQQTRGRLPVRDTEIDMKRLHSLIQKRSLLNKTEAKIWQIYCQQNYDRQKTAQYLHQNLNYVDQYLYRIRQKIKLHVDPLTVTVSYKDLYEQMKEP